MFKKRFCKKALTHIEMVTAILIFIFVVIVVVILLNSFFSRKLPSQEELKNVEMKFLEQQIDYVKLISLDLSIKDCSTIPGDYIYAVVFDRADYKEIYLFNRDIRYFGFELVELQNGCGTITSVIKNKIFFTKQFEDLNKTSINDLEDIFHTKNFRILINDLQIGQDIPFQQSVISKQILINVLSEEGIKNEIVTIFVW